MTAARLFTYSRFQTPSRPLTSTLPSHSPPAQLSQTRHRRANWPQKLTPFSRLMSVFFCPLFGRFLCSRAAFKSATRSECRGFPSSVISSSAILLPPLVNYPTNVATAAARRHRSAVSGNARLSPNHIPSQELLKGSSLLPPPRHSYLSSFIQEKERFLFEHFYLNEKLGHQHYLVKEMSSRINK